ncbi:hypothetical protein [Bacillus thuringiensis]|uniref:hypothetical protein n=1 Tax=Bacillus thuringiensis TaxID=1428 RepID=UPI000BFDF3B0|nr:hypothetical protein [Bacillus thuringiensis]PGM56017.1 hypothetical protein CN949_01650 [Bacillus thuringiensis]
MKTITTVSTKDELELAINNKAATILCTGDIAEKVNKSYKMKTVSKFVLPVLAASIVGIPFTSGLSAASAVTIAGLSGLELAAVMAIVFLGYSLVVQIINKYDKVSVNTDLPNGKVEVELERKK